MNGTHGDNMSWEPTELQTQVSLPKPAPDPDPDADKRNLAASNEP